MLSSLRLDGITTGNEAGPSTLRWPSGQPLNPINLSRLERDESVASTSRLDDLSEQATVLPKPEPIPTPLRPIAGWLDRFDFADLDLAEASQLSQSVAHSATQLDHAQLEHALFQLLTTLSNLLRVPPSANVRDDDNLDAPQLLERDRFLQAAPSLLNLGLALARALPAPFSSTALPPATVRARAELLLGFAPFTDRHAPFWSAASDEVARKVCELVLLPASPTRLPTLRHILSKSFPPLFKPHPKINPTSGRVLLRPLGGDRGMSDWYDEGEDGVGWRSQPGLAGAVGLVVANLNADELEGEWPLVLPPLLSFLDDYSAHNKLAGTAILAELLEHVDQSLLVRTGVGKVFEKSLSACFSSLADPCGPQLLTAAIPTSIKLINKLYPLTPAPTAQPTQPTTTPPSLPLSRRSAPPPPSPAHLASLARFTALSTLFASAILHTWQFHGANRALELATCEALPPLLGAFEGAGGVVRFLPALVPHLCGLVELPGLRLEGTVELRTRAGEALGVVVREAEGVGRMGRWRPRVLGAVGRGWCALREGEGAEKVRFKGEEGGEGVRRLEGVLRRIVESVRCSGEGQADVDRLLALDPSLFRELVGPPQADA